MSGSLSGETRRTVGKQILFVALVNFSAIAIGGCDFFYPPPQQRYRAIDVYADHYEFRFNTYTSPRQLAIALQATTDRIEELNVRDCVDEERLAEVLDVLRANRQTDVAISMPDDC